MIRFHFFAHSCPDLPTPFVEEAIFYSILCFCPLCQILIDHRHLGLFLGSLFCSLGLCVCSYAITRLFWLQWPCNTVWYQVLWSLLLCSSFSKLLQLFRAVYEFLKCLFCIFEIRHWYLVGMALNVKICLGVWPFWWC